MALGSPPNPIKFRSVQDWAVEFYEYFVSQTRVREENDPLPVLLAHRMSGQVDRAVTDGILMFDPAYKAMVNAVDGEWVPVKSQPLVALNYDTAFNVDGVTISTGGAKVPFDTEEVNGVPWCTFNPTTNDFSLSQGKYYIDGFVTITKTTSSGSRDATGYLAESSDLTAAVGTVRMGSLHIPSGASANSTHIVPFCGQVEVPSGGSTYAMVVNTPDSDTSFGIAHGISGYDNVFARLSISLLGLNE